MDISRFGAPPHRILMASICLIGIATFAPATVLFGIEYLPHSLPSAQGWVYDEDAAGGIPEPDVYRIEDDLLVVDTFGIAEDYNFYEHELPYLPSVARISASFTVRIIATEPQDESHALTLYLKYGPPGGPSRCPLISVARSSVRMAGVAVYIPVDATEWHEYTVEADMASGQCELYIDGELRYWWDSPTWEGGDFASFGDRTSPNNVRAEIAAVSVELLGDDVVAVEQKTWSGIKDLFGE